MLQRAPAPGGSLGTPGMDAAGVTQGATSQGHTPLSTGAILGILAGAFTGVMAAGGAAAWAVRGRRSPHPAPLRGLELARRVLGTRPTDDQAPEGPWMPLGHDASA